MKIIFFFIGEKKRKSKEKSWGVGFVDREEALWGWRLGVRAAGEKERERDVHSTPNQATVKINSFLQINRICSEIYLKINRILNDNLLKIIRGYKVKTKFRVLDFKKIENHETKLVYMLNIIYIEKLRIQFSAENDSFTVEIHI